MTLCVHCALFDQSLVDGCLFSLFQTGINLFVAFWFSLVLWLLRADSGVRQATFELISSATFELQSWGNFVSLCLRFPSVK